MLSGGFRQSEEEEKRMEKVRHALEEIQEMNKSYGISNDLANQIIQEMEHAKVCTPIIGKFSSGKSALINTI